MCIFLDFDVFVRNGYIGPRISLPNQLHAPGSEIQVKRLSPQTSSKLVYLLEVHPTNTEDTTSVFAILVIYFLRFIFAFFILYYREIREDMQHITTGGIRTRVAAFRPVPIWYTL